MFIRPFQGKKPHLAADVFVAPGAVVIGNVTIGEGSSVWYNTVIRGDEGAVTIGRRTNIQDLSMLHMTGGRSTLTIGDEVTVGHRVILHGCTIGDRCLIGMGAVIMDNAVIGEGSIVAAGAVVLENMIVPPRSLVVGMPAKVKKTLGPDEGELFHFPVTAAHYRERAEQHRELQEP
ncbi:MAG: gamma carbonic anhydrase family protein [Deltaproteobacteria bacterium]|nr:gamma carbonic anhydrase family protein [Deltaproteobacteria bacterium]